VFISVLTFDRSRDPTPSRAAATATGRAANPGVPAKEAVVTAETALHRAARLSLGSVLLTALVITLNHTYTLGPAAFGLGVALLLLPVGLLWWFRATRSRVAFAGYLLVALWVVVGFGLVEGLWGVTLPLFLGSLLAALSASFPKPTLGAFGFEASGLLSSVGGLAVLYTTARLVRARHALDRGAAPPPATPRQRAWLAAGAGLAAVAVVGAFVYARQDRWAAPAGGVVRIAVVAPTEGPYALLGGSFVRAVRMAQDDLPATRYRYELVVVDPGPDPRRARGVIAETVRAGNVDAVLGGVSLIGEVTKPYATRARVPHLCVCTVAAIGDGAYNFTNIPSPEAEAERWVPEARRRGVASVAILAQDYPSINNHVAALKAEAARAGLPVVSEERFDGATTDFGPAIARAQATAPGVFYVEAATPALDLLGQQLRDAGVRDLASVVAPSLSERPELFEGAWYTDSDLPDPGFKARFEQRYPDTPFATHMMPYAYDSFRMVVAAYERGEHPAVYVRELTAYAGTAGPLTKAPGSGNFRSTPAVWTIRDGKPELVS
jgi:ABC-type branched-subunit amino acid transport system substrate-binding protein